jgi:hypothetical protein
MEEKIKIRGNKSGKGVLGKLNVCKECNRTFLSNRSTAMWCGNTCKVKGYRKRLNKALIKEIKLRYGI